MTRYILVSSGKGGTGKTTSAINLGIALNNFNKNVVVVDANLTTPNIGLYLGVPVVPITLHDVMLNKEEINDAVYLHRSGTKVIPGSISLDSIEKIKPNLLKTKLKKIQDADFVIIDSAAGFGKESLAALDASEEVLIITNPELPAVTDALKNSRSIQQKSLGWDIIQKKRQNRNEARSH